MSHPAPTSGQTQAATPSGPLMRGRPSGSPALPPRDALPSTPPSTARGTARGDRTEHLQDRQDGEERLDEPVPGRRCHQQAALQQVQQDGSGGGIHLPGNTETQATTSGVPEAPHVQRHSVRSAKLLESASLPSSVISVASPYILLSTGLSPLMLSSFFSPLRYTLPLNKSVT